MRDIKFRAWHKNMKCMCQNVKIDLLDRDYLEFLQYTGLKDKTGKEIYEGDVLMQYDGTKRVVGFKHGAFVYTNIPKLNQAHNTFSMFWTEFENRISEEWKIIGNIYENPELLDSQK